MKIVVAVDFSQVTRKMIEIVGRMPPQMASHVYLLHAAEPDPDFVGWDAGPDVVRDQVAAQFHREHRELEDLAEQVRGAGLEVTALLIQGPTVDTILRETTKLGGNLVVVGSHGHGAAYDLLVGSISSDVIRRSAIPVLVVPSPRPGTAG
jgi:nucleotide-binding universal stress UspA family protein